jgi:hypothetical protein
LQLFFQFLHAYISSRGNIKARGTLYIDTESNNDD